MPTNLNPEHVPEKMMENSSKAGQVVKQNQGNSKTTFHGPHSEELLALYSELNKGDRGYRYVNASFEERDKNEETKKHFSARQNRVKELRSFHRLDSTDPTPQSTLCPSKGDMNDGFSYCSPAAFHKLRPVQQIRYFQEPYMDLANFNSSAIQPSGPYIDVAAVKNNQKNIEIYLDGGNIEALLRATPALKGKSVADIVRDIQLVKNRRAVSLPQSVGYQDYVKHLEQMSSYVVVRGVVHQHYEYNGDPIVGAGRETPLYYAVFPKLSGATRDSSKWTIENSKDYKLKGGYACLELKEKFRDVILLQLHVAAVHGEGVDIVTPHAFLKTLTEEDMKIAKRLFADAVVEAAQQFIQPKNSSGVAYLSVHDDSASQMRKKIEAGQATFKVPVFVTDCNDATAPNRAAIKLGSNTPRCAIAVMGEGVGLVGNAALTERAHSAMEENITRVCSGEVSLIFSGYNPNVFNSVLHFGPKSQSLTLAFLRAYIESKKSKFLHIGNDLDKQNAASKLYDVFCQVKNVSLTKGEVEALLEKMKGLFFSEVKNSELRALAIGLLGENTVLELDKQLAQMKGDADLALDNFVQFNTVGDEAGGDKNFRGGASLGEDTQPQTKAEAEAQEQSDGVLTNAMKIARVYDDGKYGHEVMIEIDCKSGQPEWDRLCKFLDSGENSAISGCDGSFRGRDLDEVRGKITIYFYVSYYDMADNKFDEDEYISAELLQKNNYAVLRKWLSPVINAPLAEEGEQNRAGFFASAAKNSGKSASLDEDAQPQTKAEAESQQSSHRALKRD